MCVCEREREVCVCVCVRERERGRLNGGEKGWAVVLSLCPVFFFNTFIFRICLHCISDNNNNMF